MTRRWKIPVLAALVAPVLHGAQPTLLITSPLATDYVTGPITIRAAVDPAEYPVSEITLFADGRAVCTRPRAPWECRWDAGSVLTEHVFRAVATLPDGTRLVANVRTKEAGYVEAVNVDAVQVAVIVTDDDGRFVKGLTRRSFHLVEDGTPQDIVHFAAADASLDLAVAIDVSGSMAGAIDDVKGAVKRFLGGLRPGDAVSLIGFNDNIFTVARRETVEAVRARAVDRLVSWGGTAFYDATVRALELLKRGAGRKAVVVFTDGDDQSSRLTAQAAVARVEQSDAVLYAVAQGEALHSTALRVSLERFAVASGGQVFFEKDLAGLDRAFSEIMAELSNHYVLGYAPTNSRRDGTWRRIKVDVDGSRYRVRARAGYRAAGPQAARR